MLFVYIGVASVVISLLLLFGLERLTLQKRTKTDVAVELREKDGLIKLNSTASKRHCISPFYRIQQRVKENPIQHIGAG